MGTLASQAEIGVWVQAPGMLRFCGGTGVTPRKIFEILCGKSRNLVNFGREIVRNAVHNACNSNSRAFLKHFNNGNGIPRVPP